MGYRGELVQLATRAAWNIVRALEKPGMDLPTGTEIRTACANARIVSDLCDALGLEEAEEQLEGWVTPPGDFNADH